MPSTNLIASWQRNVQMGKETTDSVLATTLNVLGTIGMPTTDLGPEFVDTGTTGSGTSERLASEFAVGKKQGVISFDFPNDETRFYQMCRSLFQSSGTKTGTGPYTFVFNPWTDQPATNITESLILSARNTETNGGLSLLGSICRSVKLEASEGTFIKAAAEFQGKVSGQVTAAAAAGTWLGTQQHMHFNSTLKIAGGANVKPTKVSLELLNNLIPSYGTSQLPTDFALGNFGLNIGFNVPWHATGIAEFANYLNKTTRQLTLEYGTAGAAGYIKFDADFTYKTGKIAEENGLSVLPVEAMQSKNATTTAITIVAATDLSLT